MKSLLLSTILVTLSVNLFAQYSSKFISKPLLDTSVFYNWPAVETPAISNDGKYVSYIISNQPRGMNTLMIQALENDWKNVILGGRRAIFSNDSREVFYFQDKDSLCIMKLGGTIVTRIYPVKAFSLFMQDDTEHIAYQLDNLDKGLVIRNLCTGVEQKYAGVDRYLIGRDGKVLVSNSIGNQDLNSCLVWINLQTGQSDTIWKGENVKSILLDDDGIRLAFIGERKNAKGDQLSSCWYYRAGENKAEELVNDRSVGIDSNLCLEDIYAMSKDSKKLFVDLKERELPNEKPVAVKLTIWSYMDAKLQSRQLAELEPKRFRAVINLDLPKRILRLQGEDDNRISSPADSKSNEFLLMTRNRGEGESSMDGEAYWNINAQPISFIVGVNDGKRIQLNIDRPQWSREGKFVIGYPVGRKVNDLYCYEVTSGRLRNLTKNLPIPFTDNKNEMPIGRFDRGLRVAGWFPNDSLVLVFDRYDFWKLDPKGIRSPICLTNGRNQGIVFRLPDNILDLGAINPNEPIVLKAHNEITKQDGFYSLDISHGTLKKLYMGDCYFGQDGLRNPYPLKARDAPIYLVGREEAAHSPNIYSTTDFKKYNSISNVHPEDKYNWYTTRLMTFKTIDGVSTQAVLYIPDNFNPAKKYPIIIHYYDKMSDELNKYQVPAGPNGDLDIAWFSSHDYLVLITDIHYRIQKTGESIYSAILGAVHYISHFPFVDTNHIGIQGHSWGGYETNYLVTHSSRFAAAVSSSGMSDLVSCYGSLWGGGNSQEEYIEMRRGALASTPWERTDLYIKNSPIFFVGDVKTPILMIQNKSDMNVHYEQGLEFFTALRRAGKRVWWLDYDNGGHGLSGIEYKDYIIRMTQFFDHYLKGDLPPRWMTLGVPARRKGIDEGIELDSVNKISDYGLLMKSN